MDRNRFVLRRRAMRGTVHRIEKTGSILGLTWSCEDWRGPSPPSMLFRRPPTPFRKGGNGSATAGKKGQHKTVWKHARDLLWRWVSTPYSLKWHLFFLGPLMFILSSLYVLMQYKVRGRPKKKSKFPVSYNFYWFRARTHHSGYRKVSTNKA